MVFTGYYIYYIDEETGTEHKLGEFPTKEKFFPRMTQIIAKFEGEYEFKKENIFEYFFASDFKIKEVTSTVNFSRSYGSVSYKKEEEKELTDDEVVYLFSWTQ